MQPEAIKSEQVKIFRELHKFPDFYLAGGTGLALQIGHRISVDFDLFYQGDLPKGLLEKIRRVFKDNKIDVSLRHSEQVTVYINNVRLDFVKYKFPLVLKPVFFEKARIAQVLEIAAMKAYALNFRGTLKDYVDLYFVLKNNFATLSDIEKLGNKKYGNDFNFRLFLEQLVNLSDIQGRQKEEMAFLKEKVNKTDLQKFFRQAVAKIKI